VSITLVFSAIIAPALFWTAYFYYKDRFQPEPLLKFGSAYLLGLAAGFGCLKVYDLLSLTGIGLDPEALAGNLGRWSYLAANLVIIGPLEELSKFLPFFLVTLRFREFDEKTDGIIYAAAVALGFASFENLGYLAALRGFDLFGRAFASPLTHAVFASVWGYPMGKAFLEKKALFLPALAGIPLAGLCHGLFNFLTSSAKLRFLGALLILALWIWVIVKLEGQKRKKRSDACCG
jgi:RsiW-degrading membrane proteinase PrsW (M82 family)